MDRMLVVSGLHLDRAWTRRGPRIGDALRQWSSALLGQLVEAAREHEADGLVVVGDLFDRSSTLPSTMEYAAAVLQSFGGPVIIVPGIGDWYGGASPYSYGTWPSNVQIATTTAFSAMEAEGIVWASAWTSPVARSVALPADVGGLLLVRPSVAEPAGLSAQLPDHVHLLTSGEQHAEADGYAVVRPLVEVGHTEATALLLDLRGGALTTQQVSLGPSPVRTAVVDLGRVVDDQEAFDVVCAQAADGEPTVVRAVGVLPAAVLPPSLLEPRWPDHLLVDEGGLEYASPAADADDRTTQGEFMRAMAEIAATPRERHIATALGLQAMTASGA